MNYDCNIRIFNFHLNGAYDGLVPLPFAQTSIVDCLVKMFYQICGLRHPLLYPQILRKKKLYTNMYWAVKTHLHNIDAWIGFLIFFFFLQKEKNVTLCHIQISIFISEPLAVK